jgi:hypothetical protein
MTRRDDLRPRAGAPSPCRALRGASAVSQLVNELRVSGQTGGVSPRVSSRSARERDFHASPGG